MLSTKLKLKKGAKNVPAASQQKQIGRVAPTSTAALDRVMDTKKPQASITRKKGKRACRSSSQKTERSPRCTIRTTALDNSMKKKSNFECSEASAYFRDSQWSPSYKSSCQLGAKCLKQDEPDLQNRDFKSPSSADETVVRYLNDRPAIDALQNSDPFLKSVTPTRSEKEKTGGSRAKYAKMSLSITVPDAELKNPQLAESSASSASAFRLDILKHHQHDAKLEKLKERIRKQWEFQKELNSRGQFGDYIDHPVIITAGKNTVTPKVRKAAAAPPAPSYKDAKIHTLGGKVGPEDKFLNLSRELCQDLELQLEVEGSVVKETPAKKRKNKAARTVHEVQRVTELPGHDSKPGSFNIISASSWRDGKRLARKILGPAPKVKKQAPSSIDGSWSDRSIKSASYMRRTESDSVLDVTIKSCSGNPKQPCSKMRRENSSRKRDAAVQDTKQRDHHINKDFLSVAIQGILGDLQVDSVTQSTMQETDEENQNSEVPAAFTRSHCLTKKKTDKLAANKALQVPCKKQHYDTDEVRQYIVKQQQERKKKQREQKKAQKEAAEQRNKRLQELYKKQREALANKPNSASAPKLVPKQLPKTSSKLLLDEALLEEPQTPIIQDVKPNPGYHPSEDSNKEDKVQGHPPSASSNSNMSLCESHHSLVRDNLVEPLWIQPDRLSSKSQLPFPQPSAVLSRGLFSQHLSLDHMSVSQKDVDSFLSTRSHSTAVGSLPLASPPVISTLQPTMNQYKGKLDRIEALKATAASLSSRIESEAKRLAGIGMDYRATRNSGHDLVQGNQGNGYWAKASSPSVREENDVFSATLQNMLSACVSQFDSHLPGLENPGVGKTISPHAAAVSLPCKQTSEGIVGNLSKKGNYSPKAGSIVVLHDCSVDSISEQWLSDHLLSEEEGNQHEHSPLKTAEALTEAEFRVADKKGNEPIVQFQKEAENDLPISTQMGSASGPWEEITQGSPHSVIDIFTKSNQRCEKGFEEWSGPGSPVQRPSLPVMSPPASIVSYEDDFISSQGSGMMTDKKTSVEPSVCSSRSSLKEDFTSRKLSYKLQAKEFSYHSSGSPSANSCSSKGRGKKERLESFTGVSHVSWWKENRMFAESDTKTSVPSSGISSREQTPDSDNTLEELSSHSLMSLPDKIRSPRTRSCPQSPSVQKQVEPVAEQSRSSSRSQETIPLGPRPNLAFPDVNLGAKTTGTGVVNDPMHFSPAGLQYRILAELNYLSTIEESLQQLSDVEQVQGISLVQQKIVSLAQTRKAQKEQHERDLALLELKVEQEALEEAQQKEAQAHAESLRQLVQSREDAAEAIQETMCKIAAQQMEAALLTTDAAQEICKLTEVACAQNPDAVTISANTVPLLLDQKQKHHSTSLKKVKACSDISRKTVSVTPSQNKEVTGDTRHPYSPSLVSCSESLRSKAGHESSSNSHQESPFVPFSKGTKKVTCHEKPKSYTEEKVMTTVNDSLQSNSIPSIPDERDSTSVATEYSLKFDSMTEDEIEEESFRSLLPSESHRRINLKKRGQPDYSDEEASSRKMALSPVKELSLPFSGGQDSFSKFTMEMVRQYMKEEEMRAAHQSLLLQLREKALKEKTKVELAWLEHQEKRLRDKGEDDKMPPIRKKQRGLILKLQQEKAEIKHLQEANEAAQKERQMILKQQEEIEQICQTTIKLQEKLKSAGENKLKHHREDDGKQTHSSSPLTVDTETISPSSISSSDTCSIMQILKKMHNRVDMKFLTKREQKLMQRRQHAEELLQWKHRLDAEEAKIRQIEKQALAAWDKELLETKANKMAAGDQNDQKGMASEEDSSVPRCSRFNSGSSVLEELGNLAVDSGPSKVSEVQEQLGSPDHTTLMEEMVYTQEIESSVSPGKLSPSKRSTSLSKQGASKGTHRTGRQQHLPVKSQEVSYSLSDESLSMTKSETTSDQSDIESRIQALKDELQKRKSVLHQLKKEQKKRHKERLKAQEASLVKQLETYDEFIKKTEAELSQDLEAAPTAKPQIKTPSSVIEKPKIKPPTLHRLETARSWKSLTDSEHCRASLESIAEHIDAVSHSERSVSAYTKKFIEAEIQTEECFLAPSPGLKVPQKAGAEWADGLDSFPSLALLKDLGDLNKTSHVLLNTFKGATSCDTLVSTNRSVIVEEVESVKLENSEPDDTHKFSGKSNDSALDTEQKSCLPVSLKTSAAPEIGLAVTCVQDAKELLKQEECYKDDECAALGQASQKLDKTLLSEQLPVCTEPLYSNNFERSSAREYRSGDGAPHTDYYKNDFDTFASSLGKDSMSQGEKSWYTKTPKSRSASIGSDEEVSECLSDKALSVASSINSERLLILKSPTELMKSKEHSDVEGESAHVDSSLWASSSMTEEENTLQDFSIGDRVLVSNVQPGTLRFKGLTNFAKGFWAGVELDEPEGRNNGTYDGIKYFDCKEKHGIFAPPQKISRISENFGGLVDTEEHSFSMIQLDHNHKADHKDRESAGEIEEESEGTMVSQKSLQDKSQRGASASEGSIAAEDYLKLSAPKSQIVAAVEEVLSEEQDVINPLKSSADSRVLPASSSDVLSFSLAVLEKSATPFLDLLTKERSQLEAQLRLPSHDEEESKEQREKVGLLTDSFLQAFVKGTVNQLQQIRKVRNEKIQFSNQELAAGQEQKLAADDLQSILISSQLDDGEVSSPNLCPKPESPLFSTSGQEELAKRLAELELSWEFLSVLGDDQDWFDEDFGLSTRKLPPKQAEESAVVLKIESPKVPPKPCEELLAVPHTTEEVEVLVHEAAEELWKCKELGHDLQVAGFPRDLSDSLKDDNIEAISKQIYKQAVFDLTREIFGGIFAEHPNLNQSIWMKPCRITSSYFPRVRDPSDLQEIKSFIATEALKLLNLKKEPSNRVDWQKMVKFGHKKCDRVDHILVQELHEEEAQWVNYEEDELYVKMQLADEIFEDLIRETIDVLNQINKKQERLLSM